MTDELRELDQPDPPAQQESFDTKRRALIQLADLRELQERAKELGDRLAKITPKPQSVDPAP